MEDINTQFGPYQIRDELGRSQLYTVYLAYQREGDQLVALKVPTETIRDDAELRARFLEIGHQAANLDHPSIVKIYAANEIDGYPYIASEYVAGVTLRRWLSNHDGHVAPEEAIRIAAQVAAALQHAHRRGMVHGAVHPDNIFVTDDKRVVVADFGLAAVSAAATGGQPPDSMHPADLAFVAPEQFQRNAGWGYSTDVYGLGAVTYFMLTGALPFAAKDPAVLRRAIVDDLPTPPEHYNPALPAGIAYVLKYVLAKEPALRYGTPDEFVAALQEGLAWSAAEGARGVAGGAAGGATRRRGRGNRAAAFAVVALLAIVAAALFLLQGGGIPGNRLVNFGNGASEGVAVVDTPDATPTPPATETPTPTTAQGAGADTAAATPTDSDDQDTRTAATSTDTPQADDAATALDGAAETPNPAPDEASTLTAAQEDETDANQADTNGTESSDPDTQEAGADRPATDGGATAPQDAEPLTPEATPGLPQAVAIAAGVNLTSSAQLTPSSTQESVILVPTVTDTPEPTATDTDTPEPTATVTDRPEPTATVTDTPEPTATDTRTPRPTATDTDTPEPTATPRPTSTRTPTRVPTATNTRRPIATATTRPPTATATRTPRPTLTPTRTRLAVALAAQATATNTPRPTATERLPATETATPRPTATRTPQPSPTRTNTPRPTLTPTRTSTPLPTFTPTPLPTFTPTPLPTFTPTPLPTFTPTPLPTFTSTPLPTFTPTPLPTFTSTPLPTFTPTPRPTFTPTPLPTFTSTPVLVPTATPTATPIAVNTRNFTLVSPGDGFSGGGTQRFEWSTALTPGANQGFEVVFWREDQTAMGSGFGLAAPTTSTSVNVDLDALDQRLGDLLEPGLYRWGVLLVQVDPYERLAFTGASHSFVYNRSSGGGDSSAPSGPGSGE